MLWVFLGSLPLIYWQSIDGVLINKPITFYVDTQNLKTDKTVYKIGDPISVLFSFCRHRDFTTTTQWKLINETVVFFPELKYTLHAECQKNKYVYIGTIPPYAIPGLHHLEGTTAAKFNPLSTLYYSYVTQDFEVK